MGCAITWLEKVSLTAEVDNAVSITWSAHHASQMRAQQFEALIKSLLRDSGWTSTLSEAGVASSGTAESFLVASSVTQTRQAHQVTACSLYKLMEAAYNHYCNENVANSDILHFENWCENEELRIHSSAFGTLSCLWS